jgi:hypothetical protein
MYSDIKRVDSQTQNLQENMAFKDQVRCIIHFLEKQIQLAKYLWHNSASICRNLRTHLFQPFCLAKWVLQKGNLKVQQWEPLLCAQVPGIVSNDVHREPLLKEMHQYNDINRHRQGSTQVLR